MKNPFIKAKVVGRQVDPELYHNQPAKRGSNEFVMSRSELYEFNKCPSRWLAGYRDSGSSSTEYGDLLDCRLLDPSRFAKRFALKPETYVNEKGETKEWNGNATVCRQWKEKQVGKTIVSAETMADVSTAIARLKGDPITRDLIELSSHQVYLTADYKDADTGLVVPVKCLIDIEPNSESERSSELADLKSTSSASLRDWPWSVFKFAYHWQAALYLDVYNAATGDERTGFIHIVQESFFPFEIGKRLLSAEFIELGRCEYRRALARYCQCLDTKDWPGYDYEKLVQGFSLCEPEARMLAS